MPILELQPSKSVNPESAWLSEHAHDEHSQFGEDGILAKALSVIGKRNGWCVEAGAWDGKHLSNTRALMLDGWSGVFVEGDPKKMRDLQTTYGANSSAHLLLAMVGFEPEDGFDAILSRTPVPRDFDLLSLDIDSVDYYVWEATISYRPRLVIVEFNPTVPNDVIFVQDKDSSIKQGCSLRALIELGRTKNYELIATTCCNGIFVVAEEFDKFGISDNSIDAMHFPELAGRIFHAYDGTIYTAGMPKLIWHDRKIEFEEMQVLPPNERYLR